MGSTEDYQSWENMNIKIGIEGDGNVKRTLSSLNGELITFSSNVNKLNRGSFATLGKGMTEFSDIVDDLDDKIAKSRKPFAGWALSIMFAGMAIERASKGIMKFGTKAFQEISHSVEGTVTNTDRLEGSMKFLGFTIGQALEPLMAWLVPIIEGFANWVSENESLVGWLVAAGIAIGTFATLWGGIKLAIDGFSVATGLAKINFETLGKTIVAQSSTGLDAFNVLKGAIGAGLLLVVAYKIFGKGKDEVPTAKDWITNLGLAAIGGYLAAGVAGGLIAVGITLMVMVSQAAANKVLKDVEKLRDLTSKVWAGKLTAKEAIQNFGLIKWEGTVLPESAVEQERKQIQQLISLVQPQQPTINLTIHTFNNYDNEMILENLAKEIYG